MFDALKVAILNVLEKGNFVVRSVLLKEKKISQSVYVYLEICFDITFFFFYSMEFNKWYLYFVMILLTLMLWHIRK